MIRSDNEGLWRSRRRHKLAVWNSSFVTRIAGHSRLTAVGTNTDQLEVMPLEGEAVLSGHRFLKHLDSRV